MRRPTTVLAVIAILVVGVALVLRSGDAEPPPGDTPEASTTSDAADTTTVPGSSTVAPPTTGATAPPVPSPPAVPACDLYGEVRVTGSIDSPDLVEASGLAVSRVAPAVRWSHNDSRGGPVLYAFDASGTDLGAYTVPDAFALDWEDLAAGPGPDGAGDYLYVGDMGDNFGIRDGLITVFRVPDVDPAQLDGSFPESTPIVLLMPDGPFDAEALFVDPVERALYVVTKSPTEAFVFRGPLTPTTTEPHLMELVATLFLDAEVSGADISHDGGVIAFRGYRTVWMWNRAPGQSVADALAAEPCEAPSPEERQGESVAFDAQLGYWTVSEGSNTDIHHIPVG